MGSGTITRDLENSLQRAQENFIKSQIEVRKNLDSEKHKESFCIYSMM